MIQNQLNLFKLPKGYELEDKDPKIGGNGVVFTCTRDGQRYALKVFTKNFEQYLHEAYICKTLKRHENVIQLIDSFDIDNKKGLVLEYCQIDLKGYLANSELNISQKLLIFGQILSAFKAIQEDLAKIKFYFQHRDIKPQNVMVGDGSKIKIIDFGESRIVDLTKSDSELDFVPSTQLCGTPGYMDPMMEYLGEGFQEKSDIWSLGATLYYIVTRTVLPINKALLNTEARKKPINERKLWKIQFIQNEIEKSVKNIENEECRRLLGNLLKINPKKRYGWQNLFSDEFVKSLLIVPNNEKQQFQRKKIIRLSDEIQIKFISSSFEDQAGRVLTYAFKNIIQKGLHGFQTAKTMFSYFQEIKFTNNDFLNNWQYFEKLNYLLHLRSLLVFHSYIQILSLKQNKYKRESIISALLQDLKLKENMEISERIQLQIYYLFDCIKKSLEGNGLEARLLYLQKEPLKDEEQKEYPNLLSFDEDEKEIFSFKKVDNKNLKNNPDHFNNNQFYDIFSNYLEKCIEIFLRNYKILKRKQVLILFQLAVCYDLDEMKQVQTYYNMPLFNKKPERMSKIKILNYLFDNFDLFDNLFQQKTTFNTQFYLEIISFKTNNAKELKKINSILEGKFPQRIIMIQDNQNVEKIGITIHIKFQQFYSQLWCSDDGSFPIQSIFQTVENIIQQH